MLQWRELALTVKLTFHDKNSRFSFEKTSWELQIRGLRYQPECGIGPIKHSRKNLVPEPHFARTRFYQFHFCAYLHFWLAAIWNSKRPKNGVAVELTPTYSSPPRGLNFYLVDSSPPIGVIFYLVESSSRHIKKSKNYFLSGQLTSLFFLYFYQVGYLIQKTCLWACFL
jgi:hypothetical protein